MDLLDCFGGGGEEKENRDDFKVFLPEQLEEWSSLRWGKAVGGAGFREKGRNSVWT